MYYPYLLVADGYEEQYNADDAQDENDDAPENSLVRRMTIGVNDYVAFKIIAVARRVAMVGVRCFLVTFATSDALPYHV